jgi:shikimate kinase
MSTTASGAAQAPTTNTDTPNNIVLIGMPGAGKSTAGVVLAKMIGYDFVDADLVIQQECDKSLQKLIDTLGPLGFIEVENEVLKNMQFDRTVISTGGSAVYSDEAIEHLRQIGTIVYMQTSLDELRERLADFSQRGVVMKREGGMGLADLYDERIPLYEKFADITVNVEGVTVAEAADKIRQAVGAEIA